MTEWQPARLKSSGKIHNEKPGEVEKEMYNRIVYIRPISLKLPGCDGQCYEVRKDEIPEWILKIRIPYVCEHQILTD